MGVMTERTPTAAQLLVHIAAALGASLLALVLGLSSLGMMPWLSASLLVLELRQGETGRRRLRWLAVRAAVVLVLLTAVPFLLPGMTPRLEAMPAVLLWQLSVVFPFVYGTVLIRSWLLQLPIAAVAFPVFLLAFSAVRVPMVTSLEETGLLWHRSELRDIFVRDGTRLSVARFDPPGGRSPVGNVLLVHGLGAEKYQFLGAVAGLRSLGFEVWTFDARGHGESSGLRGTFGRLESRDVTEVWQRIGTWTAAPDGIRLAYGVSVGGAATQLAVNQGRLEGLDGLVLDSTFARLRTVGARRIPWIGEAVYTVLDFLYADVMVLGVRVLDVAPIDGVRRSGVPTLLIHAKGDPLIPVAESRALAAAYGERGELVELTGSAHAMGFLDDAVEHGRALRRFVERVVCPRVEPVEVELPQRVDERPSLRGLSIPSADVAWASGSGGTILRSVGDGGSLRPVPSVPPRCDEADFRDVVAFGPERAFVMSVREPAAVFETRDGGLHWEERVAESDPDAFFDSLAFRDDRFGVLFGDPPSDGAFYVATTTDGGATWSRVPGRALPEPRDGEAGFAASGTCIAFAGRSIVIATGGVASRVLLSEDDGVSWRAVEQPVGDSESSSGVFSVAFSNAERGVVVGGDYLWPDHAVDVAARCEDAGASWHRAITSPGGYRSSVVALRADRPGVFLATGPNGSDWTVDGGLTWVRASTLPGCHAVAVSPDGRCAMLVGAGASAWRIRSFVEVR
jgi:alpha-beta hydrolase superfamily lysophospholipase/photosystem II stability/assembly factor-like uncharacterized protein